MKNTFSHSAYLLILFMITLTVFTSCSEWIMPVELPGTYTGVEKIISRHQKEGQYIFFEDQVPVSLVIGNNREVTGTVGNASFVGCKVEANRGWAGRAIHIKTDFIIRGKLTGNTFVHDTLLMKEISIPFNMENGELKGSLFLISHMQNLPLISSLKLKKQ